MTSRKLEALRALAERPGTPAEGEVARAMLAKLEGKEYREEEGEATSWYWFERYLKTRNMDDLEKAARAPQTCACGSKVLRGATCASNRHARFAAEIQARFPRGTRCYYNCWAYDKNCPGKVAGYSKDWSWVRIKFEHLKGVRSVPIIKAGKWHLSTEPLSDAECQGLRDGMENYESSMEPK